MGKKIIFIILFLVMLPIINADFGTFQQGSNVIIKTNLNANNVNLSIYFPNSSLAVNNQPMTQQAGDLWNYTFISTDTLGDYLFHYCKVDGTGCASDTFTINYSGKNLTLAQAFLYLTLMFFLLFSFVLLIFAINQLPSENEKDEEGKIMSINNLKHLRKGGWFVVYMVYVGIIFLASNLAFAFLNEHFFADILFIIFRISFGMSPLIAISMVMWIFVDMFYDRKFQEMINRGFFPQGRDM